MVGGESVVSSDVSVLDSVTGTIPVYENSDELALFKE